MIVIQQNREVLNMDTIYFFYTNFTLTEIFEISFIILLLIRIFYKYFTLKVKND